MADPTPDDVTDGVSWCAQSRCWECGRTVRHKPYGGPQKWHACRRRWLSRSAWRSYLDGWHSGYRWAAENPDDPLVRADADDYGTGWAGHMRVGHLALPEADLIDCRVCGGSGVVPEPDDPGYPEVGAHPVHCPCTYRRPCDLMCRCSGGPL